MSSTLLTSSKRSQSTGEGSDVSIQSLGLQKVIVEALEAHFEAPLFPYELQARDLIILETSDLLRVKGIGPARTKAIIKALESLGLYLKDDPRNTNQNKE